MALAMRLAAQVPVPQGLPFLPVPVSTTVCAECQAGSWVPLPGVLSGSCQSRLVGGGQQRALGPGCPPTHLPFAATLAGPLAQPPWERTAVAFLGARVRLGPKGHRARPSHGARGPTWRDQSLEVPPRVNSSVLPRHAMPTATLDASLGHLFQSDFPEEVSFICPSSALCY